MARTEPDAATLVPARRGLFELYRTRGASVWIEAVGSSMQPSIRDGDWLLLDFAACEAKIGEIVFFPLGQRLVVHRVIRRSLRDGAWVLETKGDARLDVDPPVHATDVLGVVRAVRAGEHGTATSAACCGARAITLATLSTTIARATSFTRRLPEPLGRPLRRIARTPTRIALDLAARAPRYQSGRSFADDPSAPALSPKADDRGSE
jgi:hypothetical protein